VLSTIHKVEEVTRLSWRLIFLYVTNYEDFCKDLPIDELPADTLVFTDSNLQHYFSRTFYGRCAYIIVPENTSDLIGKPQVKPGTSNAHLASKDSKPSKGGEKGKKEKKR